MTKNALLITRPRASADRFVARLSADLLQGIDVILSPLLEIAPTGANPDVTQYAGVIFTSSSAVNLAPPGNGQTAYCVGRTTADHAQAAGWQISVVEQTADDLVAKLHEIKPAGPLLHLAGLHRRGDIGAQVAAMGVNVDVEILYDQKLLALSAQAQLRLEGEGRVVVPLFSPRTAQHFMQKASRLHNVTVVAMSDAVAECCQGMDEANLLIAAAPTGQEMLRRVEKLLRDISLA